MALCTGESPGALHWRVAWGFARRIARRFARRIADGLECVEADEVPTSTEVFPGFLALHQLLYRFS